MNITNFTTLNIQNDVSTFKTIKKNFNFEI